MINAFAKRIDESSLSQSDKALWHEVLTLLEPDQIKSFSEFIGDDHDRLVMITNNIRQKHKALESNDIETLHAVEKQEQEYIDSLK